MKILYHHRTLAADGMAVHIRELVAALRAQGHEVIVVGPGGDTTGTRPAEQHPDGGDGVAAWMRARLPGAVSEIAELGYNLPAYRQLASAYRRFRPDVLYERHNLFLLAGLWLRRRVGVPLLLEVNAPISHERAAHGGLHWRRLAARLERRVWRGADAVLPVTRVLAVDHLGPAGVAEERIHVIPNGIDPTRFHPGVDGSAVRRRYGLDGRLVLGFTGYVRPWHGLDRVLDVVAAHGAAQDIHLLVVGDGPARDAIEAKAAALSIAGRVTFAGNVEREAVPAHIAAFDIALQPSAVAYACPLKLVEYMAMGKAIVAPDQPNIRELVSDGETAQLFDPANGLADALTALVADPDRRQALGARAARSVSALDRTWAGNATRVAALAERLMGERGPAADAPAP